MPMQTIFTYVGVPADEKKTGTGVILNDQRAAAGKVCVLIAVDRSRSTSDVYLDIQRELKRMVTAMQANVILKGVVTLIVVTYNHGYEVLVNKPLGEVTQADLQLPQPAGATDTGKAVMELLKLADEKRDAWKRSQEPYFQPILFLLTDGYPDAGTIEGETASAREKRQSIVEGNYRAAADSIRTRLQNKKLLFAAGGFQKKDGPSADMKRLAELADDKHTFCIVNGGKNGGIGLDEYFNALITMTSSTLQGTSFDTLDDQMLGEVFSRGKQAGGNVT